MSRPILSTSKDDLRRFEQEILGEMEQTGEPSVANVANVAVASGRDWPNPRPLSGSDEPRPYPLEALPTTVRAAAGEALAFSQAPDSLVACSALSAVSLSVQGLASVRRAEGLEGPVNLYFLALADSGERKTTVDELFLVPVREYEQRVAERLQPELAEYRADVRAWEMRVKAIETRIQQAARKGETTAAVETELRALESSRPITPRIPRLIYGDVTPEALARGLGEKWPSAGLMSAEAGLVLGGHGMSKDSVLRNLALLNQAWDGRLAPADRVTRESVGPRTVRLTCGLAAQPESVRAFLESSRGLARGTGFLARFLTAWPKSKQGFRLYKEPPPGWPALEVFRNRLSELLELPLGFDESGGLNPPMLDLSQGAKRAWVRFHNDVERELRPSGMMATARDFAAKAADNAARLAALFHVLENGPEGQIGAEAIETAARIVAWHCTEALRFTGEIVLPAETRNARRLEEWLIDKCRATGSDAIERRDVQRCGPSPVRKAASLDEALTVLVDAGRARESQDRPRAIEVNPALLGGDHGAE